MGDQPVTRVEMVELLAAQRKEILTDILNFLLPHQEIGAIRLGALERKLANADSSLGQLVSLMETRLAELERKLFFYRPAA